MLTPTQIKALCEQYRLNPSKKYGQNYLIQPKPVLDMIGAGELTPSDTVVEVGPGFGVLTLPLTEKVAQVYAFEIEQKLCPYWEETVQAKNLEMLWGNALNEFPKLAPTLPKGYKILANLPYQITSNILRTFLEASNAPERIVVMVQKEVAERMCAKPGDMSMLAVSVQYYGTPKIVSIVRKGNFFPSPKVDSAIIQITDIKPKDAEVDAAFFRIVKAGFSNKRKQLAKNISGGLQLDKEVVAKKIADITGSLTSRPQELSIAEWKALVVALQK
jgi:16S rRNA (adenine1518-N6/adenine1519-N6)-dimethyltransferase